jgi:hypothetical protein
MREPSRPIKDRGLPARATRAVQRLSRDRVRDLAEEIWTASSGYLPPVRDLPNPRSSRAGAAAQTAYHRRREQERATWRPGWAWQAWAVAGAALAAGLLIGLTVGAWLGWSTAVTAALLAWSRLRFRPLPGWPSGSGRPRCSGARPPSCVPWVSRATWSCTTSPCRAGWTAWSTWWSARRASGWWRPGGAGGCCRAAAPRGDRPRPARACRRPVRDPGGLGPGPGPAPAVRAQPLVGVATDLRRPRCGGP